MIRARTLPHERGPRMRPVQLGEGETEVWRDRYMPYVLDTTGMDVLFLGAIFTMGSTGVIHQILMVLAGLSMSWVFIYVVRETLRRWRFAYTLTNQRILISSRSSGHVAAEIPCDNLVASEIRKPFMGHSNLWLFPKNPELSASWPFRYRTARRMPGLADPVQFQKLLQDQQRATIDTFELGDVQE